MRITRPQIIISEKTPHDVNLDSRRTNHDQGVCDGGEDIYVALEDERKDREHAAEAVDGHESDRDAHNSTVRVDFVKLWPVGTGDKACAWKEQTK